MRITERIVHPATPERVHAMLVDEDYQHARCARSGALSHEVAIEAEDGDLVVVTRRRMATTGLPEGLRSVVGQHLDLVETTRWGPADPDGSREAAVELHVEGTPVSMVGGVHLGPTEAGTVHTVDGELDAHVPLLGGRIEKAAAPLIAGALRVEQDLGREWLSEH